MHDMHPTEIDPKKNYTVTEVAEILEYNPGHIRRLCDQNLLPGAYKKSPMGHSRWVIPGVTLIQFMEARNPNS